MKRTIIFLLIVVNFILFIDATASKESFGSNREKGKSNGEYPYAAIDEKNIVTREVYANGKVLELTLPNKIKAFLVIPRDTVIEGAIATIAPYTEMPTSPNHPALSNELGYGVRVEFDSAQSGVGAYIVFDLKGGEAQKEAAKLFEYYNYCDPSKVYFNPIIAAQERGVPATQFVNKEYAVVSPLFDGEKNNLVFLRKTYPIGIDGLLVAHIDRTGVYIPQRLDRELARELINTTLVDYDNYPGRQEALVQSMEWGLAKELTDKQIENVLEGFWEADEVCDIIIAPTFTKILKERSQIETDESKMRDKEYLVEDFEERFLYVKDSYLEELEYDSKGRQHDIITVENAIGLAKLKAAGIPGAADVANRAEQNLEQSIDTEKESYEHNASAQQAAQYLTPEEGKKGAKYLSKRETVRKLVSQVINNPKATLDQLKHAARMAKQYDLEHELLVLGIFIGQKEEEKQKEEEEKKEKKRKELEAKIMNPNATREELLELSIEAGHFKFDDLANLALLYAETAPSRKGKLKPKTLKTYGIQDELDLE